MDTNAKEDQKVDEDKVPIKDILAFAREQAPQLRNETDDDTLECALDLDPSIRDMIDPLDFDAFKRGDKGKKDDEDIFGLSKVTGIGRPKSPKILRALPGIGAVAGSIVARGAPIAALGPIIGAPLSLPAGIAGASLGAAGGEALKQIGEKVLGYGEVETMAEASKQIGLSALTAGGIEGLFGVGGMVVGKALAPFAAHYDTGAKKLVSIARKMGVELAPADIMNSKFLAGFHQFLNNTLTSADDIYQWGLRKQEGIKRALQAYPSGPPRSKEQVGEVIHDLILGERKAAKEAVDAAYEQMGQLVNREAEIPLTSARELVGKLKKHERLIAKTVQDPRILSLIKDVEEAGTTVLEVKGQKFQARTVPGWNYDSMRESISRIGDIINSEVVPDASGRGVRATAKGRVLIAIKKALEDDLGLERKDAQGRVVAGWLRTQSPEAQAFYLMTLGKAKKMKTAFDSVRMVKLIQRDPKAIVDLVVKPGNTATLKELEGAVGKKGMEPLKERMLQEMMENTFPAVKDVSPSAFAKYMKDYTEPMKKLFSEKEVGEFKDIGLMLHNLGETQRLYGNTSGTARIAQLTAAATGVATALLTGHFQLALGELGTYYLAPKAAVKFYLSPFGRKLLTEGIKTPQSAKTAGFLSKEILHFMAQNEIHPEPMPAPQTPVSVPVPGSGSSTIQ